MLRSIRGVSLKEEKGGYGGKHLQKSNKILCLLA